MSLAGMTNHCSALFARCFGNPPACIVAAPGRVNLIGEHTDYNDGFVLPMAIERHTVIAAERATDRHVTLHSLTNGETANFSIRPPLQPGQPSWANYVRGVVAGFQARGHAVPGFHAVIDSSVPFGGGLSSSAALAVGTATVIETLTRKRLDPIDKALLCQKAEHDFAGVPCGIMDQFTLILAQADHALLLDCRSRVVTPVPMADPSVAVLIINTHVRHKLADGEYAKRRAQCESAAKTLGISSLRDATAESLGSAAARLDPLVARRARHVVSENERTVQAADAIKNADWPGFGKLMYESHHSLRDDYEVSCRELDLVVEIAKSLGVADGVLGCRMTGAGFGGCAVCLVKKEAAQHVARRLDEIYEIKSGSQVSIFVSRPAAGARVLEKPERLQRVQSPSA